jgi:hypothetical protein
MRNGRVSDPNDHLFFNEINSIKERIMHTQSEVPQVVMKAIDEAINKLRVTGCAFKVMLPNDEFVIHDIDRIEPKKIQRNRTYAHGELKQHYWPYLANLQVGEVASIPYSDELPVAALQSSATAYLSNTWGNGSYTTSTNKEKQVLEVLRLK